MSTFLELCREVAFEAEVSSTNGPTTVGSQTGNLGLVVRYVRDAYTEIQAMQRDWRFLRRRFVWTTTASVDTVGAGAALATLQDEEAATAISTARFRSWRVGDHRDPPRIYLESAGEGTRTFLTYIDYEAFRMIYDIGNVPDAYPAHLTVTPERELRLGPGPVDVYVIKGDYHRAPQTLVLDVDVPEIPEMHHPLIKAWALRKWAMHESAIELLARMKEEIAWRYDALIEDQLPAWGSSTPLA